MDTRLKRYSPWLKSIAVVLALLIVLGAVLYLDHLATDEKSQALDYLDFYHLTARPYEQTWNYWSKVSNLNWACEALTEYSREEIAAGAGLSWEHTQELYMLYNRYWNERIQMDLANEDYNEDEDTPYNGKPTQYQPSVSLFPRPTTEPVTEEQIWAELYALYPEAVKDAVYRATQERLKGWDNALRTLQEHPYALYYIENGGKPLTNSGADSLEAFDALLNSPEWVQLHGVNSYRHRYSYLISRTWFEEQEAQYLADRALVLHIFYVLLGLAIFFLLALAYLIYATGRRDGSKTIYLTPFDKLWTELLLGLWVGAGFGIVGAVALVLMRFISLAFSCIVLMLAVALFLATLLSLMRHIKNRSLFTNSLIYKLLRAIFRPIRKLFRMLLNSGRPMGKALGLMIPLALLSLIPFASFATMPLLLLVVIVQTNNFNSIYKASERIRDGVYHENIPITMGGHYQGLADNLKRISAGLSGEVERRMKSERMKTALIANVSHDIKTPLTSLITYVDLLKKENSESEAIRSYAEVLEQKAARLKSLTDSLFEAAKASSGNINVSLEQVDIGALLSQGLGEMDDTLTASGLELKLSVPSDKVYALADGALLWRVCDNLLSNALKYSLPHSRVYLTVTESPTEQQVRIELKNISAAELNIPEEELMERFVRGDQARSTEGSGLGLDISRSLMLAMGGTMALQVDGDLFKVTLSLPQGTAPAALSPMA